MDTGVDEVDEMEMERVYIVFLLFLLHTLFHTSFFHHKQCDLLMCFSSYTIY